jgi:hypothetical protein
MLNDNRPVIIVGIMNGEKRPEYPQFSRAYSSTTQGVLNILPLNQKEEAGAASSVLAGACRVKNQFCLKQPSVVKPIDAMPALLKSEIKDNIVSFTFFRQGGLVSNFVNHVNKLLADAFGQESFCKTRPNTPSNDYQLDVVEISRKEYEAIKINIKAVFLSNKEGKNNTSFFLPPISKSATKSRGDENKRNAFQVGESFGKDYSLPPLKA